VTNLSCGHISDSEPAKASVDHGTAFDIAGKNPADPENMIAAMKMGAATAVRRAERRTTV
jgi:isocitrate/isopropylmalate dehydrogenase